MLILLILPAWLLSSTQASAQDRSSLTIVDTDISHFPTVGVLLRAYDANGNFVNDLGPADFQVLEDGYNRPVNEVVRTQSGVQIIIAINESPVLTDHFDGISIYTHLENALVNWATSLPSPLADDISLSTNTGIHAARLKDPQDFIQALMSYQPDLLNKQPGVTSLTQALDLSTDPDPDPYKKRSILYITPLPDLEMQAMLPNLTERAAQLGVQVNVWIADPSAYNNPSAAEPLLEMAEQTHGSFFTYSGSEDFPDLNSYYESMRYIYQVSYLSSVKESGEHQFAISVAREGLNISSGEQSFTVNVLPPNPIFLDPPVQVQRAYVQSSDNTGEEVLAPGSIPVQILIEFPDGYSRSLSSTRLIVDGTVVDENTSAPFDLFDWDLNAYSETGKHTIQVEVEDILGLKQTSITTQVDVVVAKPNRPWWKDLVSGNGLVIMTALAVAALVLFLVMMFTGQRGRLAQHRAKKTRQLDPVTQQVTIRTEKNRLKIFEKTIRKPKIRMEKPPAPADAKPKPAPVFQPLQPRAAAQLARINEDGSALTEGAIALGRNEYTLGSDPQKSICVLDSSSVDGLHAHLSLSPEGKFVLKDAGSTAGTWVNFAPVPTNGVILQHGDIIHLGKVIFRFEIKNPPDLRVAQIFRYNDD